MRKIILASASKRRREIFRTLFGEGYIAETSSYEEDNSLDMEPAALAMHHSSSKARDVASKHRTGVVVAADSFVVLDAEVLGKPKDSDDAKRMLKKISGKEIEVVTGLTVIDIDKKAEKTVHDVTKVWMKDMAEDEIDSYVSTGEPLDKAGSFGAQDRGMVLVRKVEGEFFNVVGIPVYKLNLILLELGIDIFNINR